MASFPASSNWSIKSTNSSTVGEKTRWAYMFPSVLKFYEFKWLNILGIITRLKKKSCIRMRLWNIKPKLKAMWWLSGIKSTGKEVKFGRIMPSGKG